MRRVAYATSKKAEVEIGAPDEDETAHGVDLRYGVAESVAISGMIFRSILSLLKDDPIAQHIVLSMVERLPRQEIRETYGLTENQLQTKLKWIRPQDQKRPRGRKAMKNHCYEAFTPLDHDLGRLPFEHAEAPNKSQRVEEYIALDRLYNELSNAIIETPSEEFVVELAEEGEDIDALVREFDQIVLAVCGPEKAETAVAATDESAVVAGSGGGGLGILSCADQAPVGSKGRGAEIGRNELKPTLWSRVMEILVGPFAYVAREHIWDGVAVLFVINTVFLAGAHHDFAFFKAKAARHGVVVSDNNSFGLEGKLGWI